MAATAAWEREGLVFLPLGGSGEIGMNLNLYGYGGRWLMVDLGITFADETLPGIDLITPDPAFIAERRDALEGLVITHAHEDHLGAVPYLWEQLECPVYATPFAAAVLRRKLAEVDLLEAVELIEVPLGGRITLGPFTLDFISLTHSIPEPNALAIRTPEGVVLHTGDWKIDPEPMVGEVTDEAALRKLGDEGVLALVCDSTNVFNPGESGSEASVYRHLKDLVSACTGRVAITTFASNVARLQSVGRVAEETGRHLVLVGRSLHRIRAAAEETGYLADLPAVLDEDEGGWLPRDKVLYLCTGCQGEPRGAMARIAGGGHRHVVLEEGDTVIFSSKIIPGNELPIARLHDQLAEAGVEVVTEKDAQVHVSGHPNRDELARMYQWARPRIAVPVHGEVRHLKAHARLALEFQVPFARAAENGQALRLSQDGIEVVGETVSGRMIVDGGAVVPVADESVRTRRRMMFNGSAVVTLVVDGAGRLLADPAVVMQGIAGPSQSPGLEARVRQALRKALGELRPQAMADDGRLEETARIAVRRVVKAFNGRRPEVAPQVIRVGSNQA